MRFDSMRGPWVALVCGGWNETKRNEPRWGRGISWWGSGAVREGTPQRSGCPTAPPASGVLLPLDRTDDAWCGGRVRTVVRVEPPPYARHHSVEATHPLARDPGAGDSFARDTDGCGAEPEADPPRIVAGAVVRDPNRTAPGHAAARCGTAGNERHPRFRSYHRTTMVGLDRIRQPSLLR
mmetsp:Transcript_17245/g.35705  ORF Transcript_17245/g.35705 Transcript_17245/m.35705 type:complete len:180 (-) Transcript_17245:143-682(-)